MSITQQQALEALDELEGSARGDEPFNHFAAPLLRQYIEQGAGAAPRYGTIAERAEQGLRNGLWATQQGVAPGADVVMTERQVRIITFALHRFMNQAYWNGQEAAQDIDGKFFPQGAAMSFYKDAEDAQELLAKKPYAVLAAVQHPQQEQPK